MNGMFAAVFPEKEFI